MKNIRVIVIGMVLLAGTLLMTGCGTMAIAAVMPQATKKVTSASLVTVKTPWSMSSNKRATSHGVHDNSSSKHARLVAVNVVHSKSMNGQAMDHVQGRSYALSPYAIPRNAVQKIVNESVLDASRISFAKLAYLPLPRFVPSDIQVEHMYLDVIPVVGTREAEMVMPVTDDRIAGGNLMIVLPKLAPGHYVVVPEFTACVRGSTQLFVITSGVNLIVRP